MSRQHGALGDGGKAKSGQAITAKRKGDLCAICHARISVGTKAVKVDARYAHETCVYSPVRTRRLSPDELALRRRGSR